ncbi:MAG: pentapeptide repeat-containing protein [Candidatus Zixiibacteriota bacterium]
MGKCQQILYKKNACGCDTQGNDLFCEFHQIVKNKGIFTKSNIKYLNEYLDSNNHDFIDLSGANINDIVFDHMFFMDRNDYFNGPLILNNTSLTNCTFRELPIHGPVSFSESKLIDTCFEYVIFSSGISLFSDTAFWGSRIPFYGCTFSADDWVDEYKEFHEEPVVAFDWANFRIKDIPFYACHIKAPKVVFISSNIESDRFYLKVTDSKISHYDYAYLVIGSKEIYLDDLKFSGHFEYTNMINDRQFAPIVRFSKINFSQMKSASFIEANLSKARFTYSILKNVNFVDPLWCVAKDGRKKIYDEVEPVKDTGDEEILREYIQLKYNYEENRDFPGASDWYYREAQARRRLTKFPILYILYHFASKYGESYWRPLSLLACTYIGFSFLYLFFGFERDCHYTNYDLFNGGIFKWSDIGNAFVFSLLAMTFQLGRTIVNQDNSTIIAFGIHLLLTLILVPLFLLALRRKFRR